MPNEIAPTAFTDHSRCSEVTLHNGGPVTASLVLSTAGSLKPAERPSPQRVGRIALQKISAQVDTMSCVDTSPSSSERDTSSRSASMHCSAEDCVLLMHDADEQRLQHWPLKPASSILLEGGLVGLALTLFGPGDCTCHSYHQIIPVILRLYRDVEIQNQSFSTIAQWHRD